jgi:hypothetical protein
MKTWIERAMLLVGVLLLPLPEVMAQAYRCGNVYQDQPCGGSQFSKPVMGASQRPAASNTSGASSAVLAGAAECEKRGADSIKIVWAREGGVTKENALAGAPDPAAKKLITDVYRVRGAAPDVRARIEAECRAEMEERARLLALHAAIAKTGIPPGDQPHPGNSRETELAEKKAMSERLAGEQQAEARTVKARCDNFESQLESNRARQRAGGGTGSMETLRRQQMDLERQSRAAGC